MKLENAAAGEEWADFRFNTFGVQPPTAEASYSQTCLPLSEDHYCTRFWRHIYVAAADFGIFYSVYFNTVVYC